VAVVWSAALAGQEVQEACPPCESPASVRTILEDSFQTILAVPDCAGASNLQTCRALEGQLAEALQTIEKLVRVNGVEGQSCLSCDPGVGLAPLVDGLVALGRLLAEKGYGDFAPSLRRMEELSASFEGLRCCVEKTAERKRSTSPEEDARAVLVEKCGASFVDNRRGLRQVVRAPGEREGCYQSRACRKPASSSGSFMDGGYWTYDGEYWYVWAERRTPRGEWTTCEN
jgi:hypothetical protein